jgi:hypothetical protein
MSYILLKVPEHVYATCCSQCSCLVIWFSLFLRVGCLLFHGCSWLLASFVRSEISVALLWDHLSILFRLIKILGLEKSSVLMKIIGLKSKEEQSLIIGSK